MVKLIPTFFFLLTLSISFGQNNEELKIDFDQIDSIQYLNFKNSYNNQIDIDSSIHIIPDSSFSLVVNNENEKFPCNKDYSDCFYYSGYIQEMNSYVINHCDSESCGTFLLNKATGERQFLASPFDSECDAPLLSKNKEKLLVYSSSVFDPHSYISIFTRQNTRENFNLENGKGIKIDGFRIYESIWIDKYTIAFKTFEKYGGETGNEPINVKYLKGKINTVANKGH